MRTIIALIKKEFLQIFRNKIILELIIMLPVVELIVLVYAANNDMKNISLGIVDRDHTTTSQMIVNRLTASNYFILNDFTTSAKEAFQNLESGKTDIIIEIPEAFEKDIYNNNHPRMAITVNAINGTIAGLASSYAGNILSGYAAELGVTLAQGETITQRSIKITSSNWFNPNLDYKSLMLPGVLAILITIMSIMLSALNIVREKEMGTIEQLNVTPISKLQFIIGKLFPFLIVGIFQLTLGLLVSVFLYNLGIQGSILLLYGVVSVYLLAVLGIGFLISTVSDNQVQAMFITLFFMIIFVLLSGLFTSTDSMPVWAQKINIINPTAYLVDIIRRVVLKGATFADIKSQFTAIVILGVCVNSLMFWRYKKIS
ncbi:MAG: ABC transporter permease [Calditrichaeota bacterium]|nr:MAG: ABC transporter permease [Calditrichota bacterium]